MGDDLKIRGVNVNLPMALFGNSKTESRIINGKDGSISNGHWAVHHGTPDLAIIRKAVLKATKQEKLPWKEPWTMFPHDPKNRWGSDTNVQATTWELYYGKRFALAEDALILEGSGSMAMLVGYLPMTWVGDNLYRPARKEMDTPYETHVDPKYYFAFRKLGFSFLVGPDTMKSVKQTVWNKDKGDHEEVTEQIPQPSVTILVRENEVGEYEVRGCLMGMRE